MKELKLIALLVAFLAYGQSFAQVNSTNVPLVQVNGTGEVRVQPNEVVINLGVETRDRNLDQARKATDNKAAAIIKYLKKEGVDPKNIQTSYVQVNPIYGGGEFNLANPQAYMAQKSMVIVMKQLDKFDKIMAGLFEVGVNRIDGIQFRVSDLEKYKTEARKLAVADAKQKAVVLTSELDARLGRVYTIHENTYGGPRPMYAEAAMMKSSMSDSGDPSIAGGEVVVTSNVSVGFIIE